MSPAACTIAPALAAATAVPSAESESMTTTSSTSGTRSTTAARIEPTTPAMVDSSSRAGITTLIRASRRRLPASSTSSGQSRQCEVRRPYHARARLCTLVTPWSNPAPLARTAGNHTRHGSAKSAYPTVRQRPPSQPRRGVGGGHRAHGTRHTAHGTRHRRHRAQGTGHSVLWPSRRVKDSMPQTKESRKYGHYAAKHDHTFKFAPADLRQLMAVSGSGPGCRGRPPGVCDLFTLGEDKAAGRLVSVRACDPIRTWAPCARHPGGEPS